MHYAADAYLELLEVLVTRSTTDFFSLSLLVLSSPACLQNSACSKQIIRRRSCGWSTEVSANPQAFAWFIFPLIIPYILIYNSAKLVVACWRMEITFVYNDLFTPRFAMAI